MMKGPEHLLKVFYKPEERIRCQERSPQHKTSIDNWYRPIPRTNSACHFGAEEVRVCKVTVSVNFIRVWISSIIGSPSRAPFAPKATGHWLLIIQCHQQRKEFVRKVLRHLVVSPQLSLKYCQQITVLRRALCGGMTGNCLAQLA